MYVSQKNQKNPCINQKQLSMPPSLSLSPTNLTIPNKSTNQPNVWPSTPSIFQTRTLGIPNISWDADSIDLGVAMNLLVA